VIHLSRTSKMACTEHSGYIKQGAFLVWATTSFSKGLCSMVFEFVIYVASYCVGHVERIGRREVLPR
jgi:hypothetical protein